MSSEVGFLSTLMFMLQDLADKLAPGLEVIHQATPEAELLDDIRLFIEQAQFALSKAHEAHLIALVSSLDHYLVSVMKQLHDVGETSSEELQQLYKDYEDRAKGKKAAKNATQGDKATQMLAKMGLGEIRSALGHLHQLTGMPPELTVRLLRVVIFRNNAVHQNTRVMLHDEPNKDKQKGKSGFLSLLKANLTEFGLPLNTEPGFMD